MHAFISEICTWQWTLTCHHLIKPRLSNCHQVLWTVKSEYGLKVTPANASLLSTPYLPCLQIATLNKETFFSFCHICCVVLIYIGENIQHFYAIIHNEQCYFEKRRLMSESSDITTEAMTSSDLFHSLTALNVKWLDLLTKSILKRLSQRV